MQARRIVMVTDEMMHAHLQLELLGLSNLGFEMLRTETASPMSSEAVTGLAFEILVSS